MSSNRTDRMKTASRRTPAGRGQAIPRPGPVPGGKKPRKPGSGLGQEEGRVARSIRGMTVDELRAMTQAELARRLKTSRQRVHQLKHLLPKNMIRNRGKGPPSKRCPLAPEQLALIFEKAQYLTVLSEELGVGYRTASRWVHAAGLTPAKSVRLVPDVTEFRRLYESGVPVEDIASRFGIRRTAVYRTAQNNGITRVIRARPARYR